MRGVGLGGGRLTCELFHEFQVARHHTACGCAHHLVDHCRCAWSTGPQDAETVNTLPKFNIAPEKLPSK